MSVHSVASLDDWREIVSHEFNPLVVTKAHDRFNGSLKVATIGSGSSVNVITTTPSLVRRTARGISEGDDESMFLSLNRTAPLTIAQEGRVVHLRRNQAAFSASFLPYDLSCAAPTEQILLKIPRRSLSLARSVDLRVLARPLDATRGEMGFLRSFVEGLLRSTGSLAQGSSEVLERATIDLAALAIQSAVGEAVPSQMERTSLYHAMLTFIRTSSGDSSLTPQVIADRFLVSRRLVFQIFEENDTSPATAIRSERLRRASVLLQSSGATISSIAQQTGFLDIATFGRAFQREFGATPSQWRTRGAGSENAAGS